MNYRITNGSVSYGAETILEEINFEVKGNEKVAIVGRNGSGKSTLLKSIINNELLEEGTGEEKFNIYKEGSPVIGYLKQIEFDDDNITMLDEILKVYKPIIDLEEKINKLVE
ncbi:MAG TPA: ABC-F type ribosomal protection protein OptrA, partial [Clostridiales bacterium]|nr:ABC-F type ribosomal protection protein OptrA [Clostridiales bacterium]